MRVSQLLIMGFSACLLDACAPGLSAGQAKNGSCPGSTVLYVSNPHGTAVDIWGLQQSGSIDGHGDVYIGQAPPGDSQFHLAGTKAEGRLLRYEARPGHGNPIGVKVVRGCE